MGSQHSRPVDTFYGSLEHMVTAKNKKREKKKRRLSRKRKGDATRIKAKGERITFFDSIRDNKLMLTLHAWQIHRMLDCLAGLVTSTRCNFGGE